MLRGIFHGMKLAAPLLALAMASHALAADGATKAPSGQSKATAVAPAQKSTNGPGATAKAVNPTTKATANPQARRYYHRHHRRGYGRRYVSNTQNMPTKATPSKNMTAGKQSSNSKPSGKATAQPVKHHNATTQKAPKHIHRTSHKHA